MLKLVLGPLLPPQPAQGPRSCLPPLCPHPPQKTDSSQSGLLPLGICWGTECRTEGRGQGLNVPAMLGSSTPPSCLYKRCAPCAVTGSTWRTCHSAMRRASAGNLMGRLSRASKLPSAQHGPHCTGIFLALLSRFPEGAPEVQEVLRNPERTAD